MAIKPSSYSLGSQPPTLKRDAGAGVWNSEPTEASMIAIKSLLTGRVEGVPAGVEWVFQPLLALKLTALTVQIGASYFGGDDAVAHFLHYLENKGQAFNIDFGGMIQEVPLAKQAYDAQIDAAKAFVETLPPGRHTFTSTTGSLNHAIGPQHSRNWFFAVGSYSTWCRGTAAVQTNGGKISFSMDHECIFVDRYNWDGGKQVEIPIPGYATFPKPVQDLVNKIRNVQNGKLTVTDESMAKFHRQGLAKEFEMVGTLKKNLSWRPSTSFVVYRVKSGDSLSSIAKLYYGDMGKWPVIHNANKAAIPNANVVQVGQDLKVPV